ncbi:AAA family ATPase [Patescibacteria group bacterium]|nr:AAA family ATPase [Patescibacteria group bacterium]
MSIPFFVLLGFPGSGKTTLTKTFIKKHPQFQLIFVFDFFLKNKLVNKKGVALDKDYVKKGHRFLYQSFREITQPTILELGTSLPSFNAQKIKKLKEKHNIKLKILFCVCDPEIALQRHLRRHRAVPYKLKYLRIRYQRDYPGEYLRYCKKYKLPHLMVDTTKPVADNIKIWEGLLK